MMNVRTGRCKYVYVRFERSEFANGNDSDAGGGVKSNCHQLSLTGHI